MANRYSYQKFDEKKMVAVAGRGLSISTKESVEVARFIRGKKLETVIKLLQDVAVQKVAVPFKRYNWNLAHRKGKMAAGCYPRNVSLELIRLLNNLKGAATQKGLDITKLVLVHASATNAEKRMRWGRFRGKRKNTHIELVAEEIEEKKKQ